MKFFFRQVNADENRKMLFYLTAKSDLIIYQLALAVNSPSPKTTLENCYFGDKM